MHIATKPQMILSTAGGQRKTINQDDDLSAEAVDRWMDGCVYVTYVWGGRATS